MSFPHERTEKIINKLVSQRSFPRIEPVRGAPTSQISGGNPHSPIADKLPGNCHSFYFLCCVTPGFILYPIADYRSSTWETQLEVALGHWIAFRQWLYRIFEVLFSEQTGCPLIYKSGVKSYHSF